MIFMCASSPTDRISRGILQVQQVDLLLPGGCHEKDVDHCGDVCGLHADGFVRGFCGLLQLGLQHWWWRSDRRLGMALVVVPAAWVGPAASAASVVPAGAAGAPTDAPSSGNALRRVAQ